MDGVSLSSNDIRVRRFLLRVHDDQSNSLQYYVEQISHGVYGKQNRNLVYHKYPTCVRRSDRSGRVSAPARILHHPKFFEGVYPCASCFNIIFGFYLFELFYHPEFLIRRRRSLISLQPRKNYPYISLFDKQKPFSGTFILYRCLPGQFDSWNINWGLVPFLRKRRSSHKY